MNLFRLLFRVFKPSLSNSSLKASKVIKRYAHCFCSGLYGFSLGVMLGVFQYFSNQSNKYHVVDPILIAYVTAR